MTGMRTTPVEIVKNQKIDLHPRVSLSTPPKSGPMVGPIDPPIMKMAKNVPLSLGSAISATQPEPIAMTADPPVACILSLNLRGEKGELTYLKRTQNKE